MPVPSPRNSIRIARGNYADLLDNVSEIGEGELCFALDQDKFYSKSNGNLIEVGKGTALYTINQLGDVDTSTSAPSAGNFLQWDGSSWVPVTLSKADIGDFSDADYATAAQGAKADTAMQPGDNISELNNDTGYITAADAPGTDLSYTASTRLLDSSTGSGVNLPEVVAAGDSGLMTGADKTKLDGVESGAQANTVDSVAGKTGAVTLVKGDVGLGNVDNTSDADKPVSTATQSALDEKADLVGGVIPNSQLPSLAISEYLGTAADQAAMLLLSGQRGDWCIRTDTGTTWVITTDGGSNLSDWTELATPAAPVNSVNGHTGTVVLDASDVGAAPSTIDFQAVTDNGALTDNDVHFGADARDGAATGVTIEDIGTVSATRSTGGNDLWNGFLEGTAEPTSTISAHGGATFAAGKFTMNQSGALVADGSITAGSDGLLGSNGSKIGVSFDKDGEIKVAKDATNSIFRGWRFGNSTATSEIRADGKATFGSGNITLNTDGSAEFVGDVLIGGTLPSSPNISLNNDGSAVFSEDITVNEVTIGAGVGTGGGNLVFGQDALVSNTSGNLNTAIGQLALGSNTTGFSNTAVGREAIRFNIDGTRNAAFGSNALTANTSGANNVAVGNGTLTSNTTANHNTGIGYQALQNSESGNYNIGIGANAGFGVETGSNNTIIGSIDGSAALSDTVIIGAGTTERLRIDSSGNVLIGGTLPGSPNIELNSSGGASLGAGTISMTTGGLITTTGNIYAGTNPANGAGTGSSINANGELRATRASGSAVLRFWTDGNSTETTRILASGKAFLADSNVVLDTDGSATFAGDVAVGTDQSVGLVLTSPNGTEYRLVVADDGSLSTVAV